MKNIEICQPENRNLYNKVFGGFIMRQALELAWANTYMFSRAQPFCLRMEDIWFRAPVEIGSLLYFDSHITYTQDQYIQTRVSAEVGQADKRTINNITVRQVVNPRSGKISVTNVFHYTFLIKEKSPPRIIPKTYHEVTVCKLPSHLNI